MGQHLLCLPAPTLPTFRAFLYGCEKLLSWTSPPPSAANSGSVSRRSARISGPMRLGSISQRREPGSHCPPARSVAERSSLGRERPPADQGGRIGRVRSARDPCWASAPVRRDCRSFRPPAPSGGLCLTLCHVYQGRPPSCFAKTIEKKVKVCKQTCCNPSDWPVATRRLARRSQRAAPSSLPARTRFHCGTESATATSPRLWAPRARLFYQRDMASCPQAPDCLQCSPSIAAERAPGATNLIAMEQWMPSSTLTCETPSPRGTPSGQNAWTPSVSICDHGQAEALSERGDDGKKNIKHMVVKVHALTDRMGQMRRQTQRCSAYSKGATPRLSSTGRRVLSARSPDRSCVVLKCRCPSGPTLFDPDRCPNGE